MAVNSFNAQNPPVTTKGDLFTFSTIPTRLAVGTNGQYLQADSTTATGLKWATVSAGGMTLLSTTTLSGSTTTISSISQDYTNLVVLMTGSTYSHTSDIFPRVRPNGITTNGAGTGTFNGSLGSGVGDYYLDGFAISPVKRGDSLTTMIWTFFNYTQTGRDYLPYQQQGYVPNTVANNSIDFAGNWNSGGSALSSLSIFTGNASATWSTGTVRIWGVK